MNKEKQLQASLKRKIVLRETLHSQQGYKLKSCNVTYIENGWYHMNLDGYEFDCKWDNYDGKSAIIYFKNNSILEKTYPWCESGITSDRIKYASSLHFGCGTKLINVLWVLGEVLEKKKSYEYK